MVEKPEHLANWDGLIKMMLNRLDIPTKEDIISLHGRLDKLEQLLYQKQLAAKKKRTKPVTRQKSLT